MSRILAILFLCSNDNAPDARKMVKDEISQFLGGLEPLKAGDEMVFTYVPAGAPSAPSTGKKS